ncbi:30S ribosome-binding factor RbfA [bacterium]|nr:30S ribosome-binding factor RbfA [bacterium]NUM73753.1 30S ribosome-binding factor RbfA [candidate division KSB1 bacterium]RIK79828.1 MAG: 30S ribosome-binding factor RbfA [candidate division KSB1 bacterium]
MAHKRATRVASLLREILSEIISTQLKDPAVGRITISRVALSDDLRNARVYFSMLGTDAERQKTLEGLSRAAGFLRTETGRRMDLRRAPDLQFVYDDTLDYADRIEQLLKQAFPTNPPEAT